MSHYFSEANLRYSLNKFLRSLWWMKCRCEIIRELTTGGAVISSIALLGAVLGMGPTILSVPLIGRSGASSPPGVISRQQDLPLPNRIKRIRGSKYKAAR